MLSAVIVLVGAALFVMAQTAPNAGGVWHALQTISTGSTGAVSVDADGNGVIDLAGNATQRAGMSFEVYNAEFIPRYKRLIGQALKKKSDKLILASREEIIRKETFNGRYIGENSLIIIPNY